MCWERGFKLVRCGESRVYDRFARVVGAGNGVRGSFEGIVSGQKG